MKEIKVGQRWKYTSKSGGVSPNLVIEVVNSNKDRYKNYRVMYLYCDKYPDLRNTESSYSLVGFEYLEGQDKII